MAYLEWIRSQVGHQKIFLAFASVVLYDAADRVLLQRRADFDVWGLPGGVLEFGEGLLDCARRELFEESGLRAGPLELVGVYSDPQWDVTYPNGDQVQQYTLCFQGLAAGGRLQVDGLETRELRFFAPDELPLAHIPSHYTAMLRDALSGDIPAFSPPFTHPQTAPQVENMRARIGPAAFIGVGSGAVVLDAAGRILMGRRTDDGLWDFPGGFSNLGENAAYTALRETAEETGLQVRPQRLLGVHSLTAPYTYPNGDQVQSVVSYFLCRGNGGQELADGVETSSLRWMAPGELLELETNPMLGELFQAVVGSLNGAPFVLSSPPNGSTG